MAKRMLIDATHPEETRVVVVNGTRLEQFDVETSTKKQIKGNIYLAKVVRVEPSLQAAFVDYGGNRHGFLAFSEIHPDYYQIPVADRQALLDDEVEHGAEHDDGEEGEEVDTLGGEEEEVSPRPRARSARDYKIQEVIKRRQIMLVQVVKEERGNKGAALTTYLSLAGRYSVLMPNTAKGGGVSRKITNAADRKRLKDILTELEIPRHMAVILRTAGQGRSKAEVKRDYEYLIRTWNQIRETTLQSRAPALIHEEGNLIKRAIRDVYSADIEEVVCDGDEGYRTAKDFMKILTPSHAKKVQPYKDETMPLFHRYQVDSQLDAMHSPTVQLKSGGYIVINQTEALVAIDVNSGRSTKERHIEETALKTNLEAADEVARQLRLRDLAGLVVIDFIDMEESRNNAAVERRLKDALKQDRARIQMGRISHFGLMELSRQRLRPSLMETSFETCPHCGGTGMVRSVESASVHILRVIEEEGVRRRSSEVTISVATPVALYILNNKRAALAEIESRYGFDVFLRGDDSLIPPDYRMERIKAVAGEEKAVEVVDVAAEAEAAADEPDVGAIPASGNGNGNGDEESNADKRRRRRRKRRSRRGDGETGEATGTDDMAYAEDTIDEGESDDVAAEGEPESEAEGESVGDTEETGDAGSREAKRRRRSRRGGRRRRRSGSEEGTEGDTESNGESDGSGQPEMTSAPGAASAEEPVSDAEAAIAEAEAPIGGDTDEAAQADAEVEAEPVAVEPADKPRRRRVRRVRKDEAETAQVVTEAVTDSAEPPATAATEAATSADEPAAEEKPKRRRTRKTAEAEPAEAAVAEKPKRRRTRKKVEEAVPEQPADAQSVDEQPAEAQPVDEQPVAEETDAAQASPPAVEPAPEPTAEAPEPVAASQDETPESAKPRRGWWRRG